MYLVLDCFAAARNDGQRNLDCEATALRTLLHFVRNDGQGSLMSRPLPSTLRFTIRRRTKRRPLSKSSTIITGTETSRWLFINILDRSYLIFSTSFGIISKLNHTVNFHATWDRSRRHTDRESLLSSDEEGPILSWSKIFFYSTSVDIITPDKRIIVRLSSILWIKVDICPSDKVICSLYGSVSPSDSGISVSNDSVILSNTNEIKSSLNLPICSPSNNIILRIDIYSVMFSS